jgi:hypothetical protein
MKEIPNKVPYSIVGERAKACLDWEYDEKEQQNGKIIQR